MTIKLINNNIVVLFEGSIYSTISLDSLKTIAVSTFADKNPNPLIAQFPEMTAVTIPEVLISALFQQSSLIVGDQTIGEFQAHDTLGLITLTKKLQETIAKPIISYGYNYVCNIENDSFETLCTKIQGKFFKSSGTLPKPTGSTIKYALPNLVLTKGDAKMNLKFNEIIENQANDEANFIRLNVNVHYNKTTLPTIADLKADYDEMFTYLHTYINGVFE